MSKSDVEKSAKSEVVPSSYRALAVPAQQLSKFLLENVGAQGLRPFDLDVVKVPAGGSTAWEVPSLKGPQSASVIEGIILHYKDIRSYWRESFSGGNVPPDCSSQDSIVGIGNPGGSCHKCPLAQFGTATDQNGKPAKGQACRSMRLLLFLRADDMLPILVVVPPSSTKVARQYFLRLVGSGFPYYGVTTQLRLEKAKSATGVTYSQMAFAYGRQLEQGEFEKVQLIGQAMRDLFNQAMVVDADGHSE